VGGVLSLTGVDSSASVPDLTLRNMTIRGDLALTVIHSNIRVSGGLTLTNETNDGNGQIKLGNGSTQHSIGMLFDGAQTFVQGDILFDTTYTSTSAAVIAFDPVANGETLTIGEDVLIHGGGGWLDIFCAGNILLQGTISSDVNGRLIFVDLDASQTFTVDTTGVMSAVGGGSLTIQQQGIFTNNNQNFHGVTLRRKGISNQKREPPWGLSVTPTRPPWASTIVLTR
jgi:hypothetical protein